MPAKASGLEYEMADAREIHIHVTSQPGTTVHVTVAGDDVTVTSDNTEPHARSEEIADSLGDVPEVAVEQLERSGASPNIREAIAGLREMGYQLKLPKVRPGKPRENYIRIMDPRYRAHGVGYITPTYFGFTRASDREILSSLPGAEPQTSAVKFSHVESAQPGLNAAKLLKS
jgi:hypothetical protein